MSTEQQTAQAGFVRETANDRFKRQSGSLFWGALSLAVIIHFAILAFFPNMSAADVRSTTETFEAIDIPPEVDIPPPPEPIARPATPVITDAVIDEDITIAETTFESNPIEDLPPPPTQTTDISKAPVFTPMEVYPQLKNSAAVQRAIERAYPPLLRDAGIGGRAVYWFFIDENGKPVRYQLHTSSGHDQLDRVMDQVWQMFEFSPALNREQRVPVWIELPITYQAK